jgi:hypothetical protein
VISCRIRGGSRCHFSAFDPLGYAEWNTPAISYSNYGFTGVGAWSVNLFKPASAFRHP